MTLMNKQILSMVEKSGIPMLHAWRQKVVVKGTKETPGMIVLFYILIAL